MKNYNWYDEILGGWHELLKTTLATIEDTYAREQIPFEEFVILQIKEKFGGLRIYHGGVPEIIYDEINEIIRQAEDKSYTICEFCGKPGTLRQTGWWKTLCDEHAKL